MTTTTERLESHAMDDETDDTAPAAEARPTAVRKSPRPAPRSTASDAEAEAEADDGTDRAAVRSPRLPWVLAAIGLFGTLVFGLAWFNARGDASAADGGASTASSAALLKAGRSFAEDLTNFDGATIDRDFDRITSQATGEFRTQADQFFSGDVRTQLKKAQASSRGEVRSAYVQTADDDRGTLFVVVDQTIANNASPEPQADTLRMELGMVRRDGTWKVERVSVLTAPSGASTTPTTGGSGSGTSDAGAGGGN